MGDEWDDDACDCGATIRSLRTQLARGVAHAQERIGLVADVADLEAKLAAAEADVAQIELASFESEQEIKRKLAAAEARVEAYAVQAGAQGACIEQLKQQLATARGLLREACGHYECSEFHAYDWEEWHGRCYSWLGAPGGQSNG